MPRPRPLTQPATAGHDSLTSTSLTTASPSIGAPTLTVGELAQRLGPDSAANRERLRHWTREGLLSPVGRHHAGTGNRRQYDPSSVYDGAILNAVARAGLHVVSQPYLRDALSLARDARLTWERAGRSGSLFLVISYSKPPSAPVVAVQEDSAKCNPDAELSIVINLARAFADADGPLSKV